MPTPNAPRGPRPDQDAEVASFANTMPREYRQRHHPNAIWHHSRTSADRASAVNVGTFSPGGLTTGVPLCVVADDRPGLLARICIGLEALNLDVRDAEAYLRRRLDGRVEAVDLVWVRPTGPRALAPWNATESLAEIKSVLNVVVERHLEAGALLERVTRAPTNVGHTRISWVMAEGLLMGVDVETQDRPGLLLALAAALAHERLNIVRSVVKTMGKRAVDRFYFCELDGTAVGGDRQTQIRARLLEVIGRPNVELGHASPST
ncbi:MAG: hypothetical protein KC766_07030 [Myxococcales bacterium]|nr:hypothetical protein [Myxococcales bacterium]